MCALFIYLILLLVILLHCLAYYFCLMSCNLVAIFLCPHQSSWCIWTSQFHNKWCPKADKGVKFTTYKWASCILNWISRSFLKTTFQTVESENASNLNLMKVSWSIERRDIDASSLIQVEKTKIMDTPRNATILRLIDEVESKKITSDIWLELE